MYQLYLLLAYKTTNTLNTLMPSSSVLLSLANDYVGMQGKTDTVSILMNSPLPCKLP